MRSIFILLVWSVLILSRPATAETLTIVSDYWFPMNGEPDSDMPGYMIELSKAIFEPHNIKIIYKILPWERAVKQTRVGTYNCVVGAYKSDTPDFIFPKSHWGYDSPKFYTEVMDSWDYDGTLASLNNRKIGVIQGYNYEDSFDDYAKANSGIHIQFSRGESALETNIKKLLAGRIDTLLDSSSVVNAKLNEMNKGNTLREAGNIIEPVKMYIACSPRLLTSKRYADIIDNETQRLTKNGELQKILRKYGLRMWKAN
jgi:polar amino acid transport system substrate-binding protein